MQRFAGVWSEQAQAWDGSQNWRQGQRYAVQGAEQRWGGTGRAVACKPPPGPRQQLISCRQLLISCRNEAASSAAEAAAHR